MNKLGRHFLIWRKASRLTQAQVAEKSGIPTHQISRFETDALGKVPAEDLIRVAAVYGITPNEVARIAGWWVPPKTYEAVDPRWATLQNFLATAPEEEREQLLDTIYDRVLFHEEMRRLAEKVS